MIRVPVGLREQHTQAAKGGHSYFWWSDATTVNCGQKPRDIMILATLVQSLLQRYGF